MTTTNPVSMSVLPTEQCLIEDGTNVFSVAGQLTPARSPVDIYQLCDPNNDRCFVVSAAGVGLGTAAIAELERQASQLHEEGEYRKEAEIYQNLGSMLERELRGAPRGRTRIVAGPDVPSTPTRPSISPEDADRIVRYYTQAAETYLLIDDFVECASMRREAVRVATIGRLDRNIRLTLVFSEAEAYLDVAKKSTNKAARYEYFRKADRSLTDARLLVGDGTIEDLSQDSRKIEIVILQKRLEAQAGIRANIATLKKLRKLPRGL